MPLEELSAFNHDSLITWFQPVGCTRVTRVKEGNIDVDPHPCHQIGEDVSIADEEERDEDMEENRGKDNEEDTLMHFDEEQVEGESFRKTRIPELKLQGPNFVPLETNLSKRSQPPQRRRRRVNLRSGHKTHA